MGELVNAIASLSKLLDFLINISLKPDIFRLSKLNKLGHEQIQEFWGVLHKICCFSTKTTTCNNDSFKCIESYLRKLGGVGTYFLPPNATARQLLLCFGFLLSQRIIEDNIDKVLMATPLCNELPSFMVKSDVTDYHLGTLSRPSESDPQTLLNYALLLSGKVQQNLRAIANYSQEKVQLFSKIHKATAGAHGMPHLSVGDVLMARRPEMQAEFLSKCQHCTPLFQAYSRWHRKRHIFWKWMVSVVEEEFKVKSSYQTVAEITHLHEFLRNLKSDVQKVTEEEHVPEDNITQMLTSRLCIGGNGEVLDSLFENMTLEINKLQIENENKMEEIKMNLFKTGNQSSAVSSILQTFCATGNKKKEKLKTSDVEQPLADKLQTLTLD